MRAVTALLLALALAIAARPPVAASEEAIACPRCVDHGDLVDVTVAAPGVVVDARYARADNFLGETLYPEPRLFIGRRTGARLAAAQRAAEAQGVRLLVLDAFRPWEVQLRMWRRLPDRRFVAHPARGSMHNRGCAVDVALADADGRPLAMPTPFDTFSEQAASTYDGPLPEDARRHRDLLRDVMVGAGFRPLSTEWWHFHDPDCGDAPVIRRWPTST